MKLNIFDPNQFTVDNFAKLLASKDDSQNRQLRVSKDGYIYLSDVVGNLQLDDVAFRFETWIQGNGYCGVDAAADRTYVTNEFEMVVAARAQSLSGYIDFDPRYV